MTENIRSEGPRIRQVQTGPGRKSKSSSVREKGHGKRPNATKALTVQDEEQLWKNRVLGEQNLKSLRIPVPSSSF